jgi:hypothetical protein
MLMLYNVKIEKNRENVGKSLKDRKWEGFGILLRAECFKIENLLS